MPEGRVLSPAAMIQEASKKPGKKLPLVEVALPDQSMTLQVPQGWTLQGQEAKYIIYDNPQTKTRGVGSERHTIMPTDLIMPGMQIPGRITTPYQPPPQAFQLLLNSGQIGRDPEILGQYPAEQATPTMAQIFRTMQAQGSQVDMRLLHVRFTSLATGQKLRGLFTVTCLARPMTPVWQCLVHGGWALDGEFDEYLPLYLRILDTARLNQAFANQYVAQGAARQQQLNRNLQKSIAEAGHAFDRYMDSLQNASRSRDYSSWAWSQTTLGQGTWVAENEGSRVYQTDSWGIQGPEGRVDAPAYNTTNFTGESPWGGHLDQINTRGEYEKYIRNAR
jgi:enamine deaminase RidA (YjgF/YER057c/UK114 family)